MYPFVNSLFSWYLRRQYEQIRSAVQNPVSIQKHVLRDLLRSASRTSYGEKYKFSDIRNIREYRERVPLVTYEDLKPYIKRMMDGEQNVLWPSEVKYFAKSSGTTGDKSKYIPVSLEALDLCHFRGGRDALSIYCHQYPETKIFEGKGLLIGGSLEIGKSSAELQMGDLSAVMMNNMPYWSTLFSTPGPEIAMLSDWEEKLERMADATIQEDVRSISGVPTWTMVLIKRLLEKRGANKLTDIWPNLELFIHGGVSFDPYRHEFETLIPNGNMHYLETYNASEGFMAIQDLPDSKDLLLMMDYGIYYEFIPIRNLDDEFPVSLSLDEVSLNTPYALVISTNGGLWRYLLGDTIVFTSTDPFRIRITGRTRSYINTFGEELMVYNSDYAITEACKETGARVKEYTAAPVFMTATQKGGHEWMIEFETMPDNLDKFRSSLDRHLMEVNSDYEAKRVGDMALDPPKIVVCPEHTFYRWLKQNQKLGGQHKVPRLCNNRVMLEELAALLDQ